MKLGNRILITLVFLFAVFSCENNNPVIDDNDSNNNLTHFEKGKPGSGGEESYSYPMSQEVIFLWVNPKKGFQGGQLKVENGTTFIFSGGSLTPPAGWTEDRITLSMEVDKDPVKNELIFTFGPSGCQFSPAAEVWFVYKDLGVTAPVLYYIDANGNYIPQTPDYIDFRGNKMLLKIDHFSRYAIATE